MTLPLASTSVTMSSCPMELYVGDDVVGHNGKVVYDGAGNYTYTVDNGATTPKKFGVWPNPGNILDNMEKNLPIIRGHPDLDLALAPDRRRRVLLQPGRCLLARGVLDRPVRTRGRSTTPARATGVAHSGQNAR
jgi:hypothetical protein